MIMILISLILASVSIIGLLFLLGMAMTIKAMNSLHGINGDYL